MVGINIDKVILVSRFSVNFQLKIVIIYILYNIYRMFNVLLVSDAKVESIVLLTLLNLFIRSGNIMFSGYIANQLYI